jgi:hypothetical protein
MADTLKNLGQSAPAATTNTELYVVPSATAASISSIFVANRGATSASFRIWIEVAGVAVDNKQYMYYDVPIGANDTFATTTGIMMAATDTLNVRASTADLSFSAYGVEVS